MQWEMDELEAEVRLLGRTPPGIVMAVIQHQEFIGYKVNCPVGLLHLKTMSPSRYY